MQLKQYICNLVAFIKKRMFKTVKTDFIGAGASILCLIHCLATPFVFIAKSCSATCCAETPIWWKVIDVLFLIISFGAIYQSAKNSSSTAVVRGLWFCWLVLSLIILNDHINILSLPEYSIYIPTIALVILHIYNLRYCQCKQDNCCTIHE